MFYHFMLQITVGAMKQEVDEIALQGIEFWSTVCDEEVDLGIELQEVNQPSLLILIERIIRIFHASKR